MQTCVNKIEKQTKIHIIYPLSTAATQIHLSLKDMTFSDVVDIIINQLGLVNYSINLDEPNKTVIIEVLGEKMFPTTVQIEQQKAALIHPGLPPGMTTVQEEESTTTERSEIEAFPPATPGERGMTLEALREFEAQNQQAMQGHILDWEAIPPEEGQQKGISLRQLRMNEDRAEMELRNQPPPEAFPPSNPGEKGLTYTQLKARNEQIELEGHPSLPPDVNP